MGHGGMGGGHDMSSMSNGATPNSADSMKGMDHGAMPGTQSQQDTSRVAGMDHGASGMQPHPASETGNPLVDMQTMAPVPRLDDPGIGLRNNGRTGPYVCRAQERLRRS